jgi:hypothetical protein
MGSKGKVYRTNAHMEAELNEIYEEKFPQQERLPNINLLVAAAAAAYVCVRACARARARVCTKNKQYSKIGNLLLSGNRHLSGQPRDRWR